MTTTNRTSSPAVEQSEALGHAVRAEYLYGGMADVAALTGDPAYLSAIDRIWDNTAEQKTLRDRRHRCGAGGRGFRRELFPAQPACLLRNSAPPWPTITGTSAFSCCMAISHVDVLERTLYNGLLSGVSLDGKLFFYPNPLESAGKYARSPWFGCACCPGNITRFMASVPGYFYARQGSAIYVNLFASGVANIRLDNGPGVTLTQATRYPWDGNVKITVAPDKTAKFALRIRIPGAGRVAKPQPGRPLSFYRPGQRSRDPPNQRQTRLDPT